MEINSESLNRVRVASQKKIREKLEMMLRERKSRSLIRMTSVIDQLSIPAKDWYKFKKDHRLKVYNIAGAAYCGWSEINRVLNNGNK